MQGKAEQGDKLFLAILIILIAGVTLVFDGANRISPGGVFLSVSGDIIPFLLSIWAVFLGRRVFYTSTGTQWILSVTVISFAVLIACAVVSSVVLFWFRPYARGELFGI